MTRAGHSGKGSAALAMSVCYAVALFHRTSFQGIEAPLRSEFALSAAASADLAAIFFWSYLVVMIPVGLLTDAFGPRRVSICGSLAVALGAFMFGQATSWEMLALGRIVVAVGSACAFIALMRFVAEAFHDRKATYTGRAILAGNLGAIATGAPLALMLLQVSWHQVWLGLALCSAVLALVLWFVIPQASRQADHLTSPGERLGEMRLLLVSRHVHLGILVLAGLAGASYAFGNLIGPHWLARHGFSAVAAGWQVTLLVAGYGLGAAFWGWVGDVERHRSRALFGAAGAALLCWAAIAMIPVQSLFSVSLLVGLAGFCCGAFTLVYPLVAEQHPPAFAGGAIAFVNCGIPLGAALIQTIAGRLPEPAAPWTLVGAAGIAFAGSLLLLRERRLRLLDRGQPPASLASPAG